MPHQVEMVIYYSPTCPHCQHFLQELDSTDFEEALIAKTQPVLKQPIRRINVERHPRELDLIPAFETVPHIVLMKQEGSQFVDAFDGKTRTPSSLSEFVLSAAAADASASKSAPRKSRKAKKSRRRGKTTVFKSNKRKKTRRKA